MKISCTTKEKEIILNCLYLWGMGGYSSCPHLFKYCDKYNGCSDCLEENIEWEITDE